eukprot:m.311944 g.311944  ORF g.311944 m.311944 type:complete len:69 (+) comp16393_c0_seq2:849-1055(+)
MFGWAACNYKWSTEINPDLGTVTTRRPLSHGVDVAQFDIACFELLETLLDPAHSASHANLGRSGKNIA